MMTARAEGVERPHNDCGKPVGLKKGPGVTLTGQLGGAINREREGGVVFRHRNSLRSAVHLGRRNVNQPAHFRRAGSLK